MYQVHRISSVTGALYILYLFFHVFDEQREDQYISSTSFYRYCWPYVKCLNYYTWFGVIQYASTYDRSYDCYIGKGRKISTHHNICRLSWNLVIQTAFKLTSLVAKPINPSPPSANGINSLLNLILLFLPPTRNFHNFIKNIKNVGLGSYIHMNFYMNWETMRLF